MKHFFIALLLLLSPALVWGKALSSHDAVRKYVLSHAPWPAESMRMEFLSSHPEHAAGRNDLKVRVEPSSYTEFVGDMVYLVSYFDESVIVRTETVRTRIEVLKEVVVAARNLSSGTILTAKDVRTDKRWLRRFNVQSLDDPATAMGSRLSSSLRSGSEILSSMLKEVPLVKKGKPVKVVFNTAMMQITAVGLPEEDGTAGDIIRVRNLSSNKIIYGRVVSDSVVELNI